MTTTQSNSAVGFTRLEVEVPTLWNQFPIGQLTSGTRSCGMTLIISSAGLELVHKNEHHTCRTNSAHKNAEMHSISAP
jgi:hypothetical protein